MWRWKRAKRFINRFVYSDVKKNRIIKTLEDIFGGKIFMEDRTGRGSHLTYWVSDEKGKYIAVVRVTNNRRRNLLTRVDKKDGRFAIMAAQERLEREYEILSILSKEKYSPRPFKLENGYLVIEFIDGKPLSRHCGNAENSIADYIKLTLKAIKKMHELNIFHHDLKIDNVFVSSGDIKIIDFEHQLDPKKYAKSEASAYDYYVFLGSIINSGILKDYGMLVNLLKEHFDHVDEDVQVAFLKLKEEAGVFNHFGLRPSDGIKKIT